MGAATGTLASGLTGELVTAVGFPELGGCASHILFKGSIKIGKVRKTAQGGYLIDPVLLGSLTLNKREIPTGLEKPVFFCQIFQN